MDGYWPSELNNPEAGKFSSQHAQWVHDIPKVVFSTTLDGVTWNNTTLIRENIEEEVNKLKEQPGKDLVIFGSPGLAKSFMKLGLIDEFKLNAAPSNIRKWNQPFRWRYTYPIPEIAGDIDTQIGSGYATLFFNQIETLLVCQFSSGKLIRLLITKGATRW